MVSSITFSTLPTKFLDMIDIFVNNDFSLNFIPRNLKRISKETNKYKQF
jgi:hypothetical protein